MTQAIEKNNLPGFDYFEFKRAVVNLIEMKLDEATAQKSAFTTAATLGLTKEKLIETAGYYRTVIEKEKEHFSKALENQHLTKVASRQEESKRLRDQIERHKSEIERLQDDMAGYLQQIEQSDSMIGVEAEKIEKAKAAFERTHTSLLLQVDKDIENMHKNI